MTSFEDVAQYVRILRIQAECVAVQPEGHTADGAIGLFVERIRQEEGYDWRALYLLNLDVSDERKAVVEGQLWAERSPYLQHLWSVEAAQLMLYGCLQSFNIPEALVVVMCRELDGYCTPTISHQLTGMLGMAYTAYHERHDVTEARVLMMLTLTPEFLRAYTAWLQEAVHIDADEEAQILGCLQRYTPRIGR